MTDSTSRIDVHFHIIPAFYAEAALAAGRAPARGVFPEFTPELALKLMDDNGIGYAITSLSQPGAHFGEVRQAQALARRCNDFAADMHARWPRRFGAFATLPLPDVEGSLREIDYCLDSLKFEGVCLFASCEGRFLGDPLFDPVMAELNRRRAVVFVHPAMHPSMASVGLPWPGFMMEYPFDTTRAAVNLIFTGALKRYPDIKFILSHAGGVLPFIAWRLSISPMIDPRMPQLSPEEVFAGLRHFWYDTALAPWAGAIAALREIAEPSRILFGSDWPFANAKVVPEEIRTLTAPGLLSDAERTAIQCDNARLLFPGV
ncbi:MAG: amidohydrolase family protein [Burkholderiales bacterium]